jgi:hypothetical protein
VLYRTGFFYIFNGMPLSGRGGARATLDHT